MVDSKENDKFDPGVKGLRGQHKDFLKLIFRALASCHGRALTKGWHSTFQSLKRQLRQHNLFLGFLPSLFGLIFQLDTINFSASFLFTYLLKSSSVQPCGTLSRRVRRISSRSLAFGIPISISRSSLPGRRRAGSMASGRLVAAKKITWLDEKFYK